MEERDFNTLTSVGTAQVWNGTGGLVYNTSTALPAAAVGPNGITAVCTCSLLL